MVLLFPGRSDVCVRQVTDRGFSVLVFGGGADGQERGCRERLGGGVVMRSTREGERS